MHIPFLQETHFRTWVQVKAVRGRQLFEACQHFGLPLGKSKKKKEKMVKSKVGDRSEEKWKEGKLEKRTYYYY